MIEEKEIKKLAELARIELTDAEADSFKSEFEQILEYVSRLEANKATTGNANDVIVSEHHNIFREDLDPHEGGVYTKALIDAAPKSDGNSITIGKVIKGAE